MTADNCKQTYRALQENTCGGVPAECVEPLLLWLCGSRHGQAEEAFRILGSPFDDPVQRERVYRALDAVLFDHGELLQPQGDHAARQARFRLLSRAFHPDRYPDQFDWLGPRVQTINAAFHRFKKQPAGEDSTEGSPPRESQKARPPVRQPEESFADRVSLRERLVRLFAPLAYSRYLPQKILAVTAILCALPLLYLYHQRVQMDGYEYSWTAPVENKVAREVVSAVAADTADGVTGSDNPEQATAAEQPDESNESALEASPPVSAAAGAFDEALEVSEKEPAEDEPVIESESAAPAPAVNATAVAGVAQAGVTAFSMPAAESGNTPVAGAVVADTENANNTSGNGMVDAGATTPAETGRVPERKRVAAAPPERETVSRPAPAGEDGSGREAPVARAMDVLAHFRASFEAGRLQQLLGLFSAEPRENENRGRSWFRSSYGQLFENTRSRSLQLDFSDSYSEDGVVRLVGRYRMHIVYADGRSASGRGPVQYSLIPRDGEWKISAIDYQREQ